MSLLDLFWGQLIDKHGFQQGFNCSRQFESPESCDPTISVSVTPLDAVERKAARQAAADAGLGPSNCDVAFDDGTYIFTLKKGI